MTQKELAKHAAALEDDLSAAFREYNLLKDMVGDYEDKIARLEHKLETSQKIKDDQTVLFLKLCDKLIN